MQEIDLKPIQSKLTNTQFIEAIHRNDETVLKALYTSNYHKVESLVLKNNGSKEHAKDIYQEAFLTVWKNIKNKQFQPQNKTAIHGYLYTIAKNKWMDYLRSNTYKKTIVSPTLSHIETPDDTVEVDELHNKRLKNAMDAFKNLGDSCKTLLTKFYFEKKSMKDIAKELQLDAASTRNKKYRCMQKLREIALKSPK